MAAKRVLSVGQCGADHWQISALLAKEFGAEVLSCDTAADAVAQLRGDTFDLVLVNRVLDADGSEGIQLLKRLKSDDSFTTPVMLVSNYEDAQREAVDVGAELGFGKSALHHPQTVGRLRRFLG